jgi:cytochrome c oxidase subunit 4
MAEMNAAHDAHDEHPTTTIREYLLIGLLLSVITAVELVMSLYEDALGAILIPGLLIFSAIKFVIVVAMFMHLKFDSIRFTQIFAFGFVLATTLLIAVVVLFAFDASDAIGGGFIGDPIEHHD